MGRGCRLGFRVQGLGLKALRIGDVALPLVPRSLFIHMPCGSLLLVELSGVCICQGWHFSMTLMLGVGGFRVCRF